MSRKDRRARITGRRGRKEVSFAMLPSEVITGTAFKALPDYAVRVLMALTSFNRTPLQPDEQAKNPGNNGDLALTASMAREFGIVTPWRLSAGLALLRATKLIDATRVGTMIGGKPKPTLYRLSWLPLAPSAKYDQPRVLPGPALTEWETWQPPDNWSEIEADARYRAQGKNKTQYTRVDQANQPGCIGNGSNRSTRVYRKGSFSNPPGLIPSRTRAGRGLAVEPAAPAASASTTTVLRAGTTCVGRRGMAAATAQRATSLPGEVVPHEESSEAESRQANAEKLHGIADSSQHHDSSNSDRLEQREEQRREETDLHDRPKRECHSSSFAIRA